MRALLAALFLLTAATAAAQEAEAPNVPDLQDPKYYACTTNTDCAVVRMPCTGFDTVNREYQQEVQDWADLLAQRVRCRAPAHTATPQPRCMANRCTIGAP